jgi:hypothetical protein
MIEAKTGLVIRYVYLWARERDRGEETGRKDRPVCVQMMISDSLGQELALLFPITSQMPDPATRAVSLPEIEARRVGLRTPAWVIVEEWNEETDLRNSPSIADPMPLGRLSKAFVLELRQAAIAAIRARQYRAVRR